jgi:hypothetical protein
MTIYVNQEIWLRGVAVDRGDLKTAINLLIDEGFDIDDMENDTIALQENDYLEVFGCEDIKKSINN